MNTQSNAALKDDNYDEGYDAPIDIIAADTMAGDLIACMLDELKQAPDVWQKLSEDKQQQVINRLQERVTANIRAAINIMASQGNPTLVAKVEQVVFKEGVKATLAMASHEQAVHELAEKSGSHVVIVVCDPDEYLQGCDDIKPDSDQNEIPGIDKDDRPINSFE